MANITLREALEDKLRVDGIPFPSIDPWDAIEAVLISIDGKPTLLKSPEAREVLNEYEFVPQSAYDLQDKQNPRITVWTSIINGRVYGIGTESSAGMTYYTITSESRNPTATENPKYFGEPLDVNSASI